MVDEATWAVIVDRFVGIDRTVLSNPNFFPYQSPSSGLVYPEDLQSYLSTRPGQFPGFPLELGGHRPRKEPVMSSPLPSVFSRGPVSTLQEMLRTISFVDQTIPFIRPTGRFDEATLEAVMRFQKEAGLPVTGTVDRQTWDAIMQAFLDARARLYSPRSISLFPPAPKSFSAASQPLCSIPSKQCFAPWRTP